MKVIVLFSAAMLIALGGCTSTRTIDLSRDSGEHFCVGLTDGREFCGSDLASTRDSTAWKDHQGMRWALPNARVASIRRVPAPKGMRRWSDDLAAINKMAQRRAAHVALTNGARYRAERLVIRRDSTNWFDQATHEFRQIPTAEVASIRIGAAGFSKVLGLGMGIGTGAAAGILMGLASTDVRPSGFLQPTTRETAKAVGVFFGLLGALVGMAIGSAENVFEFDASSQPITPLDPARLALPPRLAGDE